MNKKVNKIKSVVAIVLLLLLCVCFLCGCTHEENEIVDIKYEIRFSGSYCKANYYNPFRGELYIRSLDDLNYYCQFINITAFEESAEEDSESELNQILRNYDEDFFNKKALVFAIYTGGYYQTKNVTLKSIKKIESSLQIELDIDYFAGFVPFTVGEADEQWVILAEINRFDLEYQRIERAFTIYNFNIL